MAHPSFLCPCCLSPEFPLIFCVCSQFPVFDFWLGSQMLGFPGDLSYPSPIFPSLCALSLGEGLLHTHGLIREPVLCFWALLSVCPLSVFTWMLYVRHKPNSATSQNFSTSSSGFPIPFWAFYSALSHNQMYYSFLWRRPDQCVPLSASIIILKHIMLTPSQLGNLRWLCSEYIVNILVWYWSLSTHLLLISASIPCPPNIWPCLFPHNTPHTFTWPGLMLITLLFFKIKDNVALFLKR